MNEGDYEKRKKNKGEGEFFPGFFLFFFYVGSSLKRSKEEEKEGIPSLTALIKRFSWLQHHPQAFAPYK